MSTTAAVSWHIGTVGYSYPEWNTTFYSRSATGERRLAQYAAHFNAVEVNTTFYGAPTESTVRSWVRSTPPDFRFCIKMSREVTHGPTPPGMLTAPDGPPRGHLVSDASLSIARRLLDAVGPMEGRLGAILVQFPPKFAADRLDELAAFLDAINGGPRLAVEFRNATWWAPETAAALRERRVCWVSGDETPKRWNGAAPTTANPPIGSTPRDIVPTTDFLYIRWLGRHSQFPTRLQEHLDPRPRLLWWRTRLQQTLAAHPHIRHVYGFFDNDFAGHAPTTTQRLMELLGMKPPPTAASGMDGPTLFD